MLWIMIRFMNIEPLPLPPAEPAPADPADSPAADRLEAHAERAGERDPGLAARRSGMLEDLAEIGMDLARAVRQQAQAQATILQAAADRVVAGESEPERVIAALAAAPAHGLGRAGSGDVGLFFDRIARSIRRIWALEESFAQGKVARQMQAEAARTAQADETAKRAADAATARQTRRRAIVGRVLLRTVAESRYLEEDQAWLKRDIQERLADPDESHDDFSPTEDSERPIGAIIARIAEEFGLTPDWDYWAQEIWAAEEIRSQPPGSPYAEWEPPDPGPDGDAAQPGVATDGPAEPATSSGDCFAEAGAEPVLPDKIGTGPP